MHPDPMGLQDVGQLAHSADVLESGVLEPAQRHGCRVPLARSCQPARLSQIHAKPFVCRVVPGDLSWVQEVAVPELPQRLELSLALGRDGVALVDNESHVTHFAPRSATGRDARVVVPTLYVSARSSACATWEHVDTSTPSEAAPRCATCPRHRPAPAPTPFPSNRRAPSARAWRGEADPSRPHDSLP